MMNDLLMNVMMLDFAVQDAALPGNHRGADLHLPAEKAGKSSSCQSGSVLLPGRTLIVFSAALSAKADSAVFLCKKP